MSITRAENLRERIKTVDLFSEIESDLPRVEAVIERALDTTDSLVKEVSTHLLRAGGKRLRPAMVLLSAKMGHYSLKHLLPVAAAVELIHMATLVHDDVVDASMVRRGLATVNARWSNAVSVLTGDYLFARAFSMLAAVGDPRVVQIMADVVYEMSTGELQQMSGSSDLDQGQADYFERIRKKTAVFIAESCRLGAVLSGAGEAQEMALYGYGLGVGMGFQIIDDILDFVASERQLGKPVGSDLRGGVVTLPVILALRAPARAGELVELLAQKTLGDREIARVTRILQESGAMEEAYREATAYIMQAKSHLVSLPNVPARRTLLSVADFVLAREF